MNHTLSIGLSAPAGDVNTLLLEQDEWAAYAGKITPANLMKIFENVYGNGDNDDSRGCPGSTVTVFAYPAAPDLAFNIHATHGDLSSGVFEELNYLQQIAVDMVDTVRLRYAAQSIEALTWGDAVWDAEGQIIAPPGISVSGQSLFFDKKVYGQITVAYRVIRYRYLLEIEGREEATENRFDSVVYANYPGGVKWLEIEWPESVWCGMYGNTDISPGGDPPYNPVPSDKDHVTKVDYCSQEIKSQNWEPSGE